MLGFRQPKFVAHTICAIGLGHYPGRLSSHVDPAFLSYGASWSAHTSLIAKGERAKTLPPGSDVRFHFQKQVPWPHWTPSRQVYQLLVLVKQTTSHLCFQQQSLVISCDFVSRLGNSFAGFARVDLYGCLWVEDQLKSPRFMCLRVASGYCFWLGYLSPSPCDLSSSRRLSCLPCMIVSGQCSKGTKAKAARSLEPRC